MTLARQPRIASVPPEMMTDAQRSVAAVVEAGPRGGVRGPLAVLLHSPQAFDSVQRLGLYLRFESALRADLRELAVLMTARSWNQAYEWRAHAPLAEQAGVDPAAITALEQGLAPDRLTPDQALVYDFCSQLHATTSVDDAVFASVRALIGEAGVVDLCVVCGYYSMLAMLMNVAESPSNEALNPDRREP